MSIFYDGLLIFSTLLLVSCTTTPSGRTFDSPVGVWSYEYETMSGRTDSSEVTITPETRGTYINTRSGLKGRLEFYSTEDPRTWKGYWILESGSDPCSTEKSGSLFWGEEVWHFNETYNQYTGTYDICGEGARYTAEAVR